MMKKAMVAALSVVMMTTSTVSAVQAQEAPQITRTAAVESQITDLARTAANAKNSFTSSQPRTENGRLIQLILSVLGYGVLALAVIAVMASRVIGVVTGRGSSVGRGSS